MIYGRDRSVSELKVKEVVYRTDVCFNGFCFVQDIPKYTV